MARPSDASKNVAGTQKTKSGASKPSKVAPNKLVRTDAQSQTLDALFPVTSRASTSTLGNGTVPTAGEGIESDGDEARPSKFRRSDHDPAFAARLAADQAAQARARVRIAQSECALTSVKQLRKEVIEARHEGAHCFPLALRCGNSVEWRADLVTPQAWTRSSRDTSLLGSSTRFCASRCCNIRPSCTSSNTLPSRVFHSPSSPERALLMLSILTLILCRQELFYQLGLRQFGRFSRINLTPPPSLEKLVKLAVDRAHADGTADDNVAAKSDSIVQVSGRQARGHRRKSEAGTDLAVTLFPGCQLVPAHSEL